MKELEEMVDDLKNYIRIKKNELLKLPGFNSYTDGEILNRYGDIESFENASKVASTVAYPKSEIIKNFQRDADEIKKRIDEISC